MNKNPVSAVIGVLIVCLVVANFFIYSRIFDDTIPEAHYTSVSTDGGALPNGETENSGAPDAGTDAVGAKPMNTLPPDYKYITAGTADTKSGTLILVNGAHPFVFDNRPGAFGVGENTSVYYAKTGSYSVRDINVSMNEEAITALNDMLDAFSAVQGGKKSIIITQGLRSYDEQQEMLELKIAQLGENQTIAQKPGFSEHHTGYAMDISLYIDSVMDTFTGEGEYAWIFENAHKYGFVLRYPADKEAVTGISYESWHFRYVGVPHAEYMYKNNLTLEEYVDTLALYPFESAHLSVTDEVSGAEYEIYSVPVSAEGVQVPVPSVSDGSVEYSLSGDNNGHVIVTVKKAA